MAAPAGDPLPITASVEEARRLVATGARVLLVVGAGQSVAATRLVAGGPGQVLLMVGNMDDPLVRRAAEEMAAELGQRPPRGPGAAQFGSGSPGPKPRALGGPGSAAGGVQSGPRRH